MEKQILKNLVRIANADLDGSKKLYISLTKIKGVGFMFSNAICHTLNLDKSAKVGDIDEPTIRKIEDVISNPLKYNFPLWLLKELLD